MKLKSLAFALVALLCGYCGYWFYLSQSIDGHLRRLALDLAHNHGIALTYNSYEVSGFPYRLVLTFRNPIVTYKNGALVAELNAQELEAVLQPWNLNHVILNSKTSRSRMAFADHAPTHLELSPQEFLVSVHSGGTKGLRVSIVWQAVAITTNAGPWMPNKLKKLEFHLRKAKVVSASENPVFEPKALELALSAQNDRGGTFTLEAAFRGRQVPHLTRNALATWRDSAGTLEINAATLKTSEFSAVASGSFTLDDQFRVLGVIDIEGLPLQRLVSLLQEGAWLDINEGRAMLESAQISPSPELPENQRRKFSVTAQDGWLALGPVRFESIDPIVPEEN